MKGVPIKQVYCNRFIKTADLKVFRIYKDLKAFEIHTRKEPGRMAKCAKFIIQEVCGGKFEYVPYQRRYDTEKLNKFVKEVIGNKDKRLNVLEAEFRNIPTRCNPTVVIKSDDDIGINDGILDLDEKGVLSDVNDCISLKLVYDGRRYQLRLNRYGKEAAISVALKGINLEDRQEFMKFLDTEISAK